LRLLPSARRFPTPPTAQDESTDELNQWVSVLNEQANRLTTEVQRRSTTQQALIVANITASTAFAATIVSGRSSVLLLLVLPFVASALGAQYVDSHRAIQGISLYMRTELEPALQTVLKGVSPKHVCLWEEYLRAIQAGAVGLSKGSRRKIFRTWRLATISVFHGPSIVALVITVVPAVLYPLDASTLGVASGGRSVWPGALWALALVLTLVALARMAYGLTLFWERADRPGNCRRCP
jgi:hypothetical protein